MPIQVPKPSERPTHIRNSRRGRRALTPQTPSRCCGGACPAAFSTVLSTLACSRRCACSSWTARAAAMACLSTAALAAPRIVSSTSASTSARPEATRLAAQFAKPQSHCVALRAGITSGVEPDLEEDNRDIHATAGADMEHLFPYGTADGAHSWHEGDDGTWWEGIKEVFETSGGPVGAQGAISWLFIPGLIAGVYFNVDQDYLFLYTVLFIFAFIGMEMAKPSKPCHFEPDMYKLKE